MREDGGGGGGGGGGGRRGGNLRKSIIKEKFVMKIFFSDIVEWSSENVRKMIPVDVKPNQNKKIS